jgi:ferredoxin
MTDDVYEKLARRLDAIPNGFPATESGVELELLAAIFTEEEAALACVMRLTPENAPDIAARAGLDAGEAGRTLKTMARKGQIHVRKREGRLAFALMPFAVGIYEEQLPRLDAGMATLFERYIQEAHGAGITRGRPALHRVVPVEEAIPFNLEIYDHERATEMLERARSWGVRDCICRVQQRLIGKGCEHEIESCLVFAPVPGVFERGHVGRAISKQEALEILHAAEEAGLVHTTGNYNNGNTYVCNCCTCCCGILRGVAEFGVPGAVAHSDFAASVDAQRCLGCGDCSARCPFEALSVQGGTCTVNHARCVGCGVCAHACAADALTLERRPEGETPLAPADLDEWMAHRARERGISLDEIT